jgi:HD-GYP domain-containing protein (c-di-GMP phosphodiesterase class II)
VDDLRLAQKQLGRSLERASIGEDRQLANDVREKGEAFANLFYGALRMTRVYEINNESFNKPIAELGELIDWLLMHLGVVHLVTVEDQVYVNDIRIRFKTDTGAHKLGGEFVRHNVGTISFHTRPSREVLLTLVGALGAPATEQDQRRTGLIKAVSEAGIQGIELSGVNRYLLVGEEQQEESEWTEVLVRAVELVEETWNNVGAGRLLNPLSLRRMVLELLSEGIEHDGLWQAVPGRSEHGPHAVRVCRLCLLMGTEVGLSDKTLQDLGVASLVHDIGYAPVGAARPGQPAPLKVHLYGGIQVMLGQRGFHAAKIHRILGILYHHHNHMDLADIPALFGRILRIIEDYDNLTQPRGGGLNPATALAAMASAAGTAYDPVLLQALVNRLGRYPVGAQLQLDDGSQVVSVGVCRGAAVFDKPRVMGTNRRVIDLAKVGGRVSRVL